MILPDVNLLIYAHRAEVPDHAAARDWIQRTMVSDEPYGMSDLVLSAFVRIVTHRRAFDPPTEMEVALQFANAVREQPNCVPICPGPRHWEVFDSLCREPGIRGGLVTDAWLAALAIEHGCEFATRDGDFSRFVPRLRVHRPW